MKANEKIERVELYQLVRKTIFLLMDKNIITPERADIVLGFVKENILDRTSLGDAEDFFNFLTDKFPELANLKKTREKKTLDVQEKQLLELAEVAIGNDFELAEKILDYMDKGEFDPEKTQKFKVEIELLQSKNRK